MQRTLSNVSDPFKLDPNTRRTFLWIFIPLTTFSVIANSATVYSISKRNYRTFQKTCIISLALSDLLSTAAVATLNMVYFTQENITWPLAGFLCKFLPMCQMLGILASSVALTIIAIDRYRNVVYALSKRWNPRVYICLVVVVAIWSACIGISYPVLSFYECVEWPQLDDFVCVMFKPERFRTYIVAMTVITFLPLFCVFLWSYYSIAFIVWKHRKPISSIFNKKTLQEPSSSASKSSPVMKNLNKPKTQEDIRVGRKIRTFKIIIALMVVFIVCRLPYFTIQIMKYSETPFRDQEEFWNFIFAFMALHIVNCCLNPLLYTFLNVTMQVWHKIENFVLEVCCFCCSGREFESFEKENPFVIEDYGKKRSSKVRFTDEEKY
ncbi:atypical chemokine receptor 3-like [Zophobas morio]|uniref:atypical chemokine receptor 3-like n=1 Tax=Zophobas morio TaxID=2755281 RepID=UPI003083D37B